MLLAKTDSLSQPLLPIYVDREQPVATNLGPLLRICLGSAICLALAIWPLHSARAQAQAPYPGWRGYDYTPPQPDSETSSWQGDRRLFDGSPRGSFRAPNRILDTAPPERQYYLQPSDVSAPNPHHWRGLYAGAHIGGSFGDIAIKGQNPTDADLSGLMSGGYIGYDLAVGNVVTGVEFDATWSLNDGSETAFGTGRITPDIGWLTSARIRLGYAWNQFLFYGTAGLAYTNIDYNISLNGITVDKDETDTGFVIGGGVDFELTSQLSVRVVALHYEFDSTDFEIGNTTFESETDVTTVRAGLSVRF